MIDYRDLGTTTATAVSALPSAFPFQEVQVARLNLTNEVAILKNIFKAMLKQSSKMHMRGKHQPCPAARKG